MTALSREYTNLNRALDEVRSALEEWAAGQEAATAPSDDMVHHTQLVLHEWIANLLQHASYGDRSPELKIHASAEDRHITCTVVDNSEGFDLAERLSQAEEAAENLPEGGMGLRIISACTDRLSYTSTESGRYRLEFSIPADHDPCLSTLF